MSWVTDAVNLFGMFTGGSEKRAAQFYELMTANNALGELSLYLNAGYWDGATRFDDACQRLAEVLGEAAHLRPGCAVLDCGFGFGDAALFWIRRFGPATIDGLNISRSQVEKARERCVRRALISACACIWVPPPGCRLPTRASTGSRRWKPPFTSTPARRSSGKPSGSSSQGATRDRGHAAPGRLVEKAVVAGAARRLVAHPDREPVSAQRLCAADSRTPASPARGRRALGISSSNRSPSSRASDCGRRRSAHA